MYVGACVPLSVYYEQQYGMVVSTTTTTTTTTGRQLHDGHGARSRQQHANNAASFQTPCRILVVGSDTSGYRLLDVRRHTGWNHLWCGIVRMGDHGIQLFAVHSWRVMGTRSRGGRRSVRLVATPCAPKVAPTNNQPVRTNSVPLSLSHGPASGYDCDNHIGVPACR